MQGHVGPIERLTETNTDFRHVLYTGHNLQLVLMALKPGEAIGSEIHATHDQFFRIERGKGQVKIGGAKIEVSTGDAFIVPAGVRHNLRNTGKKRLRIYTIYAPPNHVDRLVEPTKADAVAFEQAQEVDTANKVMTNEGGPAPSMQPPTK